MNSQSRHIRLLIVPAIRGGYPSIHCLSAGPACLRRQGPAV